LNFGPDCEGNNPVFQIMSPLIFKRTDALHQQITCANIPGCYERICVVKVPIEVPLSIAYDDLVDIASIFVVPKHTVDPKIVEYASVCQEMRVRELSQIA